MTLALTTVADLKSWMGITDAVDDTQLDLVVKLVSARIERYLGRHLTKEAVTEVFDVNPDQAIFRLKAWPVDTGQSLALKNDLDQDWTVTAVDDGDYVVAADYGRIELKYDVLLAGPQALQIAYTGGLAENTAAVPDDVQHACRMYCSEVWRRKDQLGASQQSVGGFNINSESALKMPAIVAEMLWDRKAPWEKMGKARR